MPHTVGIVFGTVMALRALRLMGFCILVFVVYDERSFKERIRRRAQYNNIRVSEMVDI